MSDSLDLPAHEKFSHLWLIDGGEEDVASMLQQILKKSEKLVLSHPSNHQLPSNAIREDVNQGKS